MSWPDMINAGFEAGAGLAVLAHCVQLYEDKEARGLSMPAVIFFTGWGGWNMYYYPHLGQFWSLAGGIFVTLANLIYLALLVTYSRHRLARWIKRRTLCRIRGHRNDSPDFVGYRLYPCRRCGVEIFGRTRDDLPPMPEQEWEDEQRFIHARGQMGRAAASKNVMGRRP